MKRRKQRGLNREVARIKETNEQTKENVTLKHTSSFISRYNDYIYTNDLRHRKANHS